MQAVKMVDVRSVKGCLSKMDSTTDDSRASVPMTIAHRASFLENSQGRGAGRRCRPVYFRYFINPPLK